MSDDYKVGYKKPPQSTRFKKGKSGNLKGRPKKETKNRMRYNAILNTPMKVGQNGNFVNMQPYEIGVRQVLKRAVGQRRLKDINYLIDAFEKYSIFFSHEKTSKKTSVIKPDGMVEMRSNDNS